MASEYKGLFVKFEGDTTGLTAALSAIDKESRATQRNLTSLNRALKFSPKSTTLLAQAMRTYSTQIDNARTRLAVLRQAQDDLGSRDVNPAAWDRLEMEIAQCESRIEQYRAKLVEVTAAHSALGQFGAKWTELGEKISGVGSKVSSFGDTWTRTVSLGLVAAGAAAVKTAVDMDTALTGVKKTVDGTEEQYEQLKQAAIEFSQTNPVSAATIMDLEALGAQLGYGIDELGEFSRVASSLQISTDMDAETAATEMAQFANITKMAHEESSNYASAIVELGNNMATTESKISAMAQRTAAAGTQAGMTQAEILGWSAAMSSLGVEAEAGGTAFSQTISEIDKVVATGGESLDAYAKMAGMSAEEFQQAWGENATAAFESMLEGIANGENMAKALEEIDVNGVRASDVLKRMAGNTDLVKSAIDHANKGWSENTALSKEVANRNESLAAKFEILKNKVAAVAEKFGGPLADALLDAVDAAEPLFQAIADGAQAFSEMDEEQQQAIIRTVALVAAFGPLLSALGRVTTGIGNAVSSIGNAATWLSKLNAASAEGTSGIAKLAGKVGLSAGQFGLAAGGATILAGAIAAFAVPIAQAAASSDRFDKALGNMNSTLANGISSANGAADAIGQVGDAADTSSSSFEGTIGFLDSLSAGMERLTSAANERYTSAQGEVALLDSYGKTIDELGGRSDLTETEVAELNNAIDHVNQTCGTSYELDEHYNVVEHVGDAYEDAAGKVDLYIQKQQALIRAQAYEGTLSDLYNQQIAQQDAVKQKTDELTAARAKLTEVTNTTYDSDEAWAAAVRTQQDVVDGAQRNLDSANAALDETNRQIERTTGLIADNQAAAQEGASAWAVFKANLPDLESVMNEEQFNKLSEAMSTFGVSMDSLGDLDANQLKTVFDTLSEGPDATIGALREMGVEVDLSKQQIEGLNAVQIGDKTYWVSDNGSVYDQQGQLAELGAVEIEGKHYYVTSDGTIYDERGQIAGLNNNVRVNDKIYRVSNNGTVSAESSSVSNLSGKIDSIPDGSYRITGSADTSPITNVRNALQGLTGKVWNYTVKAITGNAAGGMMRGVAYHAAGGYIAHRPTVVGRTGPITHIAGEAGDEWVEPHAGGIVPLSNTRYVRPFARAVASEMQMPSGGDTNVTMNVTVSGNVDPETYVRSAMRAANRIKRSEGR
ncbi:hypothetical protein AAY81_05015 [Denitrobacterium detoxificans]|nr:phage tail tape measure protein [Denitrobacterium detoxificans]ANE21965.1 hypothetical protein AAY81_00935 [Denitrobacterium detoxificans]ANE22589.1 hypothetical protein AAY81_05015 [Denitrobacterium detoxificans]